MKHIRQFLIILLFSFLGEGMKWLLPLPIPASIYGLVLLFFALELGVVKLQMVSGVGNFLIEIMPLMFIPAGVGLMNSWTELKPIFFPVLVIMVLSTAIVMIVSGRVTQSVMRRKKKGNSK